MQDDDLYAIWPLRLARGSGPRYRQIADLIERAVAENRLQPGDRLPQRGLAQRLGIDLTTVTRGYNEAGLRGLLDPRGAAGTFISRRAEPAALVLDLGMNRRRRRWAAICRSCCGGDWRASWSARTCMC